MEKVNSKEAPQDGGAGAKVNIGWEAGKVILKDFAIRQEAAINKTPVKRLEKKEIGRLLQTVKKTGEEQVRNFNLLMNIYNYLTKATAQHTIYLQSAKLFEDRLILIMDRLQKAERINSHIIHKNLKAASIYEVISADMAESIIINATTPTIEIRNEMIENLGAMYAVNATVKIISELIELPEIAIFTYLPDPHPPQEYNQAIQGLPEMIERAGIAPGERSAENMQAAIASLFRKIDPDKQKPTEAAKEKAKDFLIEANLVMSPENITKVYKLLRKAGP